MTLALLMIFTAVPVLFAGAASYQDVLLAPAALNGYVNDGPDGKNLTVTLSVTDEQDGIEALLVEPNPDYVPLDKYSWQTMRTEGTCINARNVNAYDYHYVICDYYFVPYEGKTAPSMSISILGYNNVPSGVTAKQVTATSSQLVSNRWARATMDLSEVVTSGTATETSGTTYRQFHFMPLGNGVKAADAAGYIYIAGLTFAHELPSGDPVVTSVAFEKTEMSVTRGRAATLPNVTVTGKNSPLANYTITVSGMTSASTKLNGTSLYIGKDEESSEITVTATSVVDSTKYGTLKVTVKDPAPRTKFDGSNVLYRFGVVSDTHLSGAWNQPRSRAKFVHMIDSFVKTAEYEGAKLDALLVNGDFVDAINSTANVSSGASHSTKGEQNFREVNYVAQALWGNGGSANNYSDTTTGVGGGIPDGTKFFYALGNHDEGGQGKTSYSETSERTAGIRDGGTGTYATVYSAEYFAAVFCGWQYDLAKSTRADGSEDSYRDFIKDLYNYCKNSDTTVTAEAFETKYGVKLSDAAAKFEKFYGFDLNYSSEDGLFYGNRHMVLGEGKDAIHFVAIELSQSEASQNFAREICEQSVAENPNKPIFFITHYKIKNTIYASNKSTTQSGLTNVLKDYPQAIIWGGHSHSYLHNDDAIGQYFGFTQVESATTSYLWNGYSTRETSKGAATSGNQWPENFNTHENHNFGNGCYVEVDKNFNVRINRFDVYRSFSADYAEQSDIYTVDTFTKYAELAKTEPVNKPVYIRTPWDVTDISPEGDNLSDYTTARLEENAAPYFDDSSSISLTGGVGMVKLAASLDAKDDGMVYMYVAELFKEGETTALQRSYFTNFFFDYQTPEEVPALEINKNFVGLDQGTTYTVKITPVDEYDVSGEPLTATAKTDDGSAELILPDGRKALFVDASDNPVSVYEFEGKKYAVLYSLEAAFAANADVVYYIAGDTNLSGLATKKDTEIIGIDRDKAGFKYDASVSFKNNITFRNVYFNKLSTGDTAVMLLGKTVTLDNVKASGNPINIFNTGWGVGDKSGSLIIKGDTGKINTIYYGPNYSESAKSIGDLNIKLEGGTYGSVGEHKAPSNVADGNMINGNIFVEITGGTFTSNIYGGHSKSSANVKKNVVVKILGGDLSAATVGRTGTTYVDGKEVFVFKKSILDSTKYNASNKAILITVPDDEGGIGDPIYDDNGYITGFNVAQVEDKVSYVNGTAATTFTVEDAKKYEISYMAGKCIVFDLNGGEGKTPDTITGNVGDVVTELPSGDGLSRKNYRFIGWGTSADAKTPVTSVEITSGSTFLYAIWEAKASYTVTLDANGGTCDTATVSAVEGEVTKLPAASKDGMVFTGWAETKNAAYGEGTYVAENSDVTLYACYGENKTGTKLIYVDVSSDVDGDGSSAYNPMNTMVKAYSASDAAKTTYVLVTPAIISGSTGYGSPVGNEFPGVKANSSITFTNVDPVTGREFTATALVHENSPKFTADTTFDCDVAYISPSYQAAGSGNAYPYLNTRGHKLIFTDRGRIVSVNKTANKIPGTDYYCWATLGIRGGGDEVAITDSYLEFGNLDNIPCTPDAGTVNKDVEGSMNIVVKGGTKDHAVNFANNDQKSGSEGKARVYSGNANLFVSGYTGTLTVNLAGGGSVASATLKGSLNIIANASERDNVKFNISKAGYYTVEGGIFYVYNSEGGTVTPAEGAGTFKIETESDLIFVNGAELTRNDTDTYTLSGASDGVYVITYGAKSDIVLDENGNITDYNGDKVTVIIPEYVNGTKVTGIKANAFGGKTVEKIVLPDSVATVESGAIAASAVVYCPVSATAVIEYAKANGNILKYLGDADGNGKVDGTDLTVIARKLMGFGDTSAVDDELIYDANIDGAFSLADLSALMKQLSK